MPGLARLFLVLGAASAAVSVILGAAASHLPSASLAASQALFQTALQYHQMHALGLLITGLLAAHLPACRWIAAAGWLMVAGTLLFSGNLYLRSLAGFHDLHAVTPFGGGAYILAWLSLTAGVLAESGRSRQKRFG